MGEIPLPSTRRPNGTTRRVHRSGVLSVIFAATIVIAATYGPFSIHSFALKQSVSGTYGADEGAEFVLANAFFTSALQQTNANFKPGDRIRILYTDGVVAEFSLKTAGALYDPFRRIWRWSPFQPNLDFQKILRSPDEKASFDFDASAYCFASNVTIDTGYWGQRGEVDESGAVTVTATWISTGPVTIRLRTGNLRCV